MGRAVVAAIAVSFIIWATVAYGATCQMGPYGLGCHFRASSVSVASPSSGCVLPFELPCELSE